MGINLKVFLLSFLHLTASASEFLTWCESPNPPESIRKSLECFKRETHVHFHNLKTCADFDRELNTNNYLRLEGLSDCQYDDMTLFRNLPNVKQLTIDKVFTADWSFLLTYPNLAELRTNDLSGGRFEKLMPVLAQLKNLFHFSSRVHLEKCDLSSFENLSEMRSLHLSCSNIEDLSALKNLRRLITLRLMNGKIRNIELLETFKDLGQVILHGNQIENLEPLRTLKRLMRIDVSKNQVRDLSPVLEGDSPILVLLDASENPVYSFHTRHHSNLRELSLNRTPIDKSSLLNLKGFTYLQKLSLDGTQIDDICFLNQFPNWLAHLSIRGTRIKNLSCFSETRNLYEIYAQENGLQGMPCPIEKWGKCFF